MYMDIFDKRTMNIHLWKLTELERQLYDMRMFREKHKVRWRIFECCLLALEEEYINTYKKYSIDVLNGELI
jgi:hypothetical protein